MKYNGKQEMKEKAVKLYLENKTYIEIANILGCSRNYASKLIQNDSQIIKKKNTRILKVSKNNKKKHVVIGINLLKEIGISNDINIDEYVEVTADSLNKQIILKEHKI